MIKKFPELDKVDKDKKPDNFPIKIGHKFKSKELNSGFRMQVYESLDGSYVLRVPKITEGELCDISEESEANVMDWDGNIHAVSEFTYDEIRKWKVYTKNKNKILIYLFHI